MEGIFLLDNDLLVIQKPFNVTFEDFTNQVTEYVNTQQQCKVLPLYELDAQVSGVAVFALNDKALKNLNKQMEASEFEMRYYAVTVGNVKAESGFYNACVVKDKQTGVYTHIPQLNAGAESFALSYQLIEKVSQINLIKIGTNNINQEKIRFALSDMGNPIFGDKDYGGDTLAKNTNMALCLVDVHFLHPTQNQVLTFRGLPPETKPWSYFKLDKWFKI